MLLHCLQNINKNCICFTELLYHFSAGLQAFTAWFLQNVDSQLMLMLLYDSFNFVVFGIHFWAVVSHTHARAHTRTHTQPLYGSLDFVRWAGTRRNIHPLTPVEVISCPDLLHPSITIHGILPVQFTCLTVFFHNLSPSFLCSTSWPGTIHFILYTFHHPIIVFFSQQMPIPSQPVLL